MVEINKYKFFKRGINPIQDITDSLTNYNVEVVFDVGANIGQSSNIYLDEFPYSQIYCFEPVKDTFNQLQTNLKGNSRVKCYRLALGSGNHKGEMVVSTNSEMSYLAGIHPESSLNRMNNNESIEIMTIDEFCLNDSISHINYLKIDTEGGDLEVLKGAVNMLKAQSIDFIEAEAGMNPFNKIHVPFEELKKFLEFYEYYLFGIYEQINEWPTFEPHLRRVNPLFISRHLINTNNRQ